MLKFAGAGIKVKKFKNYNLISIEGQKDFKAFYSQYDKRTGKDFEKTFPIIGEWYRGI